jgi:hypothetical protein
LKVPAIEVGVVATSSAAMKSSATVVEAIIDVSVAFTIRLPNGIPSAPPFESSMAFKSEFPASSPSRWKIGGPVQRLSVLPVSPRLANRGEAVPSTPLEARKNERSAELTAGRDWDIYTCFRQSKRVHCSRVMMKLAS